MSAVVDRQPLNERAQATLNRVCAAIESGEAPIISQVVQIIRDISGNVDRISVAELADSISRDPTTMSRIIAIAGSLGYNPNGIEITSIQQAIAVIGFERVRNLTVSLLLMENAQSNINAEASRELGGLSVIAGMFAGELSKRVPGVEPDLAFVCSSLRGYGRLLMATFLEHDYHKALRLGASEAMAPDDAFLQMFGLTPLALGRELLTSLRLPDVMLDSLRHIPEERRKLVTEETADLLAQVSDLGLRLAEILTAPDLSVANCTERMEGLSMEYADALHLPKSQAEYLVRTAAVTAESFGSRGSLTNSPVRLFRRLECIALDREPPAYTIDAPPEPPPEPKTGPGKKGHPKSEQENIDAATRILQAGAEELAVLVRENRPNLNRIFELTIEVMQNALNLESCVIFVLDRSTKLFHPAAGTGPMRRDTRDGFVLRPTDRNVFSVPLVRGEDVVIENPDEPSVRPFIPEWLRRPGRVLPFVLLPIKDERGPFALVCATSNSVAAFQLVQKTGADLRRIRSHVSLVGRVVK